MRPAPLLRKLLWGHRSMALVLAIVRQLVRAFLVVVGVSVVVFTVTHFIGDPVHLMLPLDATHGQYVALKHQLDLDHPFWVLFVDYFRNAAHGDFGVSLWQQQSALRLAVDHVWPTLELASAATLISVVLGVPVGFLAALRPDSALDRSLSFLAVVAVSVATFWLSLVLILVFAVDLHWLPTSGFGWRNVVLPALAAAALPFGRIMQLSRTALLEELGRPYVRVARAKGLSTLRIVCTHAARNALIPVITFVGFEYAFLIGAGMIVVETIFNWPGIGYLTYEALQHRDFPLIQTCILVIAVIVVMTNLLVDLIHRILDPRVTYA
jgi:peptide/nickel transport system permease protein